MNAGSVCLSGGDWCLRTRRYGINLGCVLSTIYQGRDGVGERDQFRIAIWDGNASVEASGVLKYSGVLL